MGMNWFAYLTVWVLGLGGALTALVEDPRARLLGLLLLGTAYLGALLVGVGWPELGVYVPVLRRGSAAVGSVALTFEGGAGLEGFPAILARLKTENVAAAFFCAGAAGETQPQLLRRAETEGHLIASRGYDPRGAWGAWSTRAVRDQLARGAQALAAALKHRPRFVRLPPGLARPGVDGVLRELDLVGIAWDVAGRERDLRTPERIADWVGRRARNGSIITLRADNGPAAEAAVQVIERLRERGFTFARLDHLLEQHGYDEA